MAADTTFTITFSESVKGWTSFHSFEPDCMASLNGKFYTIKDGNLWEHHDESNSIRNNFYGTQYYSVLEFVVNQAPSEVKFIKAVSIEGNKAFDVVIGSYMNDDNAPSTQSDIDVGEFLRKEGKWYAYVRRNELTGDLTAKNAYGLGEVINVIGSVVYVSGKFSDSLIAVGDTLYDAANTALGVIQDYSVNAGTITLDTTPVIAGGTFVYGLKDGRIEGSEIRGYNFTVTLTDNTTSRLELFAFNSNVAKSFP